MYLRTNNFQYVKMRERVLPRRRPSTAAVGTLLNLTNMTSQSDENLHFSPPPFWAPQVWSGGLISLCDSVELPSATAYRFAAWYSVFHASVTLIRLFAWHSGRMSVSGWRTFPVLRSTCSWWVTTIVGKPSATGQPTRLTQPFNLSWSISNLESEVCYCVAPSGES